MALSDAKIRNAKPGEKQAKLFDGGGLFLLVSPSGGKCWRLKYRFGGKEKLLALGPYPAVSLADARQGRDDARKLLVNGVDPGEVKKAQKAEKIEAASNTFEIVAREWHTKSIPDWSKNHAERLLTRLEQDVFPFIGNKPIADIKTSEIADILERVSNRTLETAHRLKTAFYRIFHHAKLKDKIKYNPASDLRKILPALKHKHMAAPTDPKDVAPLLRAIDAFEGSLIVKCALRLAPLVFVRPGELRKSHSLHFVILLQEV